MSDQHDNKEVAPLEQINAELTESLTRCRTLLARCRSQLAANSNDLEKAVEGHEARSG